MKHPVLTQLAAAVISALMAPASSAAEEKKEDLGKISVSDHGETLRERDRQGYDSQYDKSGGKVYLGKDLVERYRGTSTADVLNSAIGVYSGDARNSGALDPNVRGIQGQGRVPVTVDGTEQALTVWRGYSGANNRNYIDPNLISSIDVEKSASLTGDVKTSVGGGIAIKTIGIDDVVPPGEEFGMSLKIDTSTNSKTPRMPSLGYGDDYRNYPEMAKGGNNYVLSDPAVNISPASQGSARFFNLKDSSGRLAVGTRQDRFDLMAAYSSRRQGNYFSGKKGAHRYREPLSLNNKFIDGQANPPADPYLPFAANVFAPGKEVTNTSNDMESWLAKANIYLTASQTLNLSYRRSKTVYGEIMPSRLGYASLIETQTQPQWPLADFRVSAYSAEYAWKPVDNQWINLNTQLWTTHAVGNTNTSGGYPREPKERDWGWEYGYGGGKNPKIDGSLINTAATNSRNDRTGFNLRNTMALTSNLGLTLSGALMKEKLDSKDEEVKKSASPFIALPRKGHRQETSLAFNFNYRPASWLELNAGARYVNGWVEDDFQKEKLRTDAGRNEMSQVVKYKVISGWRLLTREEYDSARAMGWDPAVDGRDGRSIYDNNILLGKALGVLDEYGATPNNFNSRTDSDGTFRITSNNEWHSDSRGQYTTNTNPYYNGTVNGGELAVDPVSGEAAKALFASGVDNKSDFIPAKNNPLAQGGKTKNSGWAPAFGASVWLTDNDRIYARYTETLRLPSIFENATGAGGDDPRRSSAGLRWQSERGKTAEFGYSRNLQELTRAARHADIKINYYHTVIENAFDRDGKLRFTQVDEHRTSGIEAQARYDNDGFFMDIGVDYRLTNKVCDSQAQAELDPGNSKGLKKCVTAGYPGGFLRTQLQPKYAISGNLGLRFMEEMLEVGTRMRYTSSVRNNDEADLMKKFPDRYAMANNSPMHWMPTFTADAYASYQINKNTSLELVVTNLTDRYYIDPLTRSSMPAPGRTFRLGVSSSF
ncbi:TPA: TonB-dependent receptor [Yersinia enterocolitica]|nr:TonB-dependent receptor [Yersinia enterocolitica]HEN3636373.1 TonB-dependent receptor [Yersinia enterocolitica]HEN3644496.1 TonB-dependent receptor [Yersinia enterocolitica]